VPRPGLADFVRLGGEAALREAGKLRLEGHSYVIQDGEVVRSGSMFEVLIEQTLVRRKAEPAVPSSGLVRSSALRRHGSHGAIPASCARKGGSYVIQDSEFVPFRFGILDLDRRNTLQWQRRTGYRSDHSNRDALQTNRVVAGSAIRALLPGGGCTAFP
jgi:hypothetical protein